MPSPTPAIDLSPCWPSLLADPRALLASGADADAVCFVLEGAPPGASETADLGSGAVSITSHVRGRVVAVTPDALELADSGWLARLRWLVPRGISFEPLAGRVVAVRTVLLMHRGRRPTIDATLCDADGRLLLWARDGALPCDRDARGIVVRSSQAPSGRARLVFAAPSGLVTLSPRSVGNLVGEQLSAVALRVDGDDAAFVLVRR